MVIWNEKMQRPDGKMTVQGDNDFTFAALESGLRKMRPSLCEWYDVTKRVTSPGAGRGIGRGIEDSRQCSQTKRNRARRGRDAGRSGEEVQELGGDAGPHELGWIRRAIRREGNMHEDGESDTRELEETEEGSQISVRSRNGDVGDADSRNTTR